MSYIWVLLTVFASFTLTTVTESQARTGIVIPADAYTPSHTQSLYSSSSSSPSSHVQQRQSQVANLDEIRQISNWKTQSDSESFLEASDDLPSHAPSFDTIEELFAAHKRHTKNMAVLDIGTQQEFDQYADEMAAFLEEQVNTLSMSSLAESDTVDSNSNINDFSDSDVIGEMSSTSPSPGSSTPFEHDSIEIKSPLDSGSRFADANANANALQNPPPSSTTTRTTSSKTTKNEHGDEVIEEEIVITKTTKTTTPQVKPEDFVPKSFKTPKIRIRPPTAGPSISGPGAALLDPNLQGNMFAPTNPIGVPLMRTELGPYTYTQLYLGTPKQNIKALVDNTVGNIWALPIDVKDEFDPKLIANLPKYNQRASSTARSATGFVDKSWYIRTGGMVDFRRTAVDDSVAFGVSTNAIKTCGSLVRLVRVSICMDQEIMDEKGQWKVAAATRPCPHTDFEHEINSCVGGASSSHSRRYVQSIGLVNLVRGKTYPYELQEVGAALGLANKPVDYIRGLDVDLNIWKQKRMLPDDKKLFMVFMSKQGSGCMFFLPRPDHKQTKPYFKGGIEWLPKGASPASWVTKFVDIKVDGKRLNICPPGGCDVQIRTATWHMSGPGATIMNAGLIGALDIANNCIGRSTKKKFSIMIGSKEVEFTHEEYIRFAKGPVNNDLGCVSAWLPSVPCLTDKSNECVMLAARQARAKAAAAKAEAANKAAEAKAKAEAAAKEAAKSTPKPKTGGAAAFFQMASQPPASQPKTAAPPKIRVPKVPKLPKRCIAPIPLKLPGPPQPSCVLGSHVWSFGTLLMQKLIVVFDADNDRIGIAEPNFAYYKKHQCSPPRQNDGTQQNERKNAMDVNDRRVHNKLLLDNPNLGHTRSMANPVNVQGSSRTMQRVNVKVIYRPADEANMLPGQLVKIDEDLVGGADQAGKGETVDKTIVTQEHHVIVEQDDGQNPGSTPDNVVQEKDADKTADVNKKKEEVINEAEQKNQKAAGTRPMPFDPNNVEEQLTGAPSAENAAAQQPRPETQVVNAKRLRRLVEPASVLAKEPEQDSRTRDITQGGDDANPASTETAPGAADDNGHSDEENAKAAKMWVYDADNAMVKYSAKTSAKKSTTGEQPRFRSNDMSSTIVSKPMQASSSSLSSSSSSSSSGPAPGPDANVNHQMELEGELSSGSIADSAHGVKMHVNKESGQVDGVFELLPPIDVAQQQVKQLAGKERFRSVYSVTQPLQQLLGTTRLQRNGGAAAWRSMRHNERDLD
jgi:hypothetical protein